MGFFSIRKPNVSLVEFHEKVRVELANKGFDERKRNKVEMFFHGDLSESRDEDRGIDRSEISNGIKWLRENSSKHDFSDNDISLIEESLLKNV